MYYLKTTLVKWLERRTSNHHHQTMAVKYREDKISHIINKNSENMLIDIQKNNVYFSLPSLPNNDIRV